MNYPVINLAETGKSLVEDTEIAKLKTVFEYAEPNYIKSVSDNFTVSTEGQLNIKTISISHVADLRSALDEKADRDYVATLADDVNGLKSRLTWITFN